MFPRAINLILPGTGLIPIRREWLGLALSVLFAICVNIFIAGRWIAPRAIPGWLSATALGLAIICWLTAQLLLTFFSRKADAIRREIDVLIQQGRADVAEGDFTSACAALEAAVALDDESPIALAACIEAYRQSNRTDDADALVRRLERVAPHRSANPSRVD